LIYEQDICEENSGVILKKRGKEGIYSSFTSPSTWSFRSPIHPTSILRVSSRLDNAPSVVSSLSHNMRKLHLTPIVSVEQRRFTLFPLCLLCHNLILQYPMLVFNNIVFPIYE